MSALTQHSRSSQNIVHVTLPSTERRTIERVRYHYEVEKHLADRLRNATPEERRYLYSSLYDELFHLIPDHPGLTQDIESQTRLKLAKRVRLLKRFLHSESTFLEIGAGDCSLSFEVAKRVKKVYAIDVSNEVTRNLPSPANFELILSDGCKVPVPENSIDIAFSDQLMEHIHPDDAYDQLRSIYRSLVPGGVYICLTPNRLSGPHDISAYFDEVATGFHLKEYTNREMESLFTKAGFSTLRMFIRSGGRLAALPPLPLFPVLWLEAVLDKVPYSVRRRVANRLPISVLLGIRLIAKK